MRCGLVGLIKGSAARYTSGDKFAHKNFASKCLELTAQTEGEQKNDINAGKLRRGASLKKEIIETGTASYRGGS